MTAVQYIREVRAMLGLQPGGLKARAEAAGLKYETVRYRLRRGWSYEEAFGVPAVTKNGLPYGELTRRARAAGLAPSLVKKRVDAGWSIERAISTPYQGWGGKRTKRAA